MIIPSTRTIKEKSRRAQKKRWNRARAGGREGRKGKSAERAEIAAEENAREGKRKSSSKRGRGWNSITSMGETRRTNREIRRACFDGMTPQSVVQTLFADFPSPPAAPMATHC